MLLNLPYVHELLAAISEAVRAKQWDAARADLTVLGDQIASAIQDRNNKATREVYDAVELEFSKLVTRDGPDDTPYDERSVVEELGAYIRLLDITLRRETPIAETLAGLVVSSSTDGKIVRALYAIGSGLSGRDLVDKTRNTAEHIARSLPKLRALGIVESRRIGKSTINTLTPAARTELTPAMEALAAKLPAPDAKHYRSRAASASRELHDDLGTLPAAPLTRGTAYRPHNDNEQPSRSATLNGG